MHFRFLRHSLVPLFWLVGTLASAHPHVWTEVQASLTVEDGFIDGVWTTWTFDDMFSQVVLADNDLDGDGKFDVKENALLKRTYFDNLKNYQYFSHLVLGGKSLPIPTPQKFQASVAADGKVLYTFFLPLNLRIDAKTPLAVAFYDDTFFVDMAFAKSKPLTITTKGTGKCQVSILPDKSRTFYGGQVTPIFAFIYWSPT